MPINPPIKKDKVAIDEDATPDYIGNSATTGVLRTSAPITYTDGGDYITLDIDETAIDHNILTNTHNLTTDIDHDTITNTHNLTTDIDHSQITNLDYASSGHTGFEAAISSGTTDQYWRGDKTWQTLDLDAVADGSTYARIKATEINSGIYKDATTIEKGIASFNNIYFSVSNGAVSILDNYIKNTGDVMNGTFTIDHSNTEAFLVRQNGDTEDVFTVDTTNTEVTIEDSLVLATDTGRFRWSDIAYTNVSASGTTLWTIGTDQQVSAWNCTGGTTNWTYNLDLDTSNAIEGEHLIIWIKMNSTCNSNDVFRVRSGSGGTVQLSITGNGTTFSVGCWFFYFLGVWRKFWAIVNDY